jgi:hypothetical protein
MADPLSREAKELLTEAANKARGEIWTPSYDVGGWVVSVAEREFDDDPEIRRRYLEALGELVSSGNVEQETTTKYVLTSKGWQTAKLSAWEAARVPPSEEQKLG